MENLLLLNGEIIVMNTGHWAKFVAHEIEPDEQRPQGISYSLTFHAPSGKRLIGYDNAHSVTTGSGPGKKKTRQYDHRHLGNRTYAYQWQNAEQLLVDFWTDIETALRKGAL